MYARTVLSYPAEIASRLSADASTLETEPVCPRRSTHLGWPVAAHTHNFESIPAEITRPTVSLASFNGVSNGRLLRPTGVGTVTI